MIQEIRQARSLFTAEEFRLYREGLGERLERLSPTDLKSRVRRTRSLRDKYQDVHRRQRGGARRRMPNLGPTKRDDFTRTHQKALLFEHTLRRFERRLRNLETSHRDPEEAERPRRGAERRPAAGEGRGKMPAGRARGVPRGRASARGPRQEPGAPPPGPRQPWHRVSGKVESGRHRSRNRRFQARRDSRR